MTTTYDRQRAAAVASEIFRQIGRPAMWGIGAHDLAYTRDGAHFTARILPFRKDGTRSDRARNMSVTIDLNGCDLYEVTVTHSRAGVVTTHYASDTGWMGLDSQQLRAIMYALDSDQDRDPIDWNRYSQVA